MKYISCKAKAGIYTTLEAAEKNCASEIIRRGIPNDGLKVYKCRVCNYYHLKSAGSWKGLRRYGVIPFSPVSTQPWQRDIASMMELGDRVNAIGWQENTGSQKSRRKAIVSRLESALKRYTWRGGR